MKNLKARKKLQRAAVAGIPTSEEKKQKILKKIRSRTMLFHAMLFSPIILLWATIVASLEQTPLTGRRVHVHHGPLTLPDPLPGGG